MVDGRKRLDEMVDGRKRLDETIWLVGLEGGNSFLY